jgi:TRAP-type C4-dicarboxylate transport system permease small subunit
LKVLAVLVASVAVDAAFLVAWVAVNWWVDRHVIEPLRLVGIDARLLKAFQYVFGGGTFLAVLTYVLEDIITQAGGAIGRVRRSLRRDARRK